MVATHVTVLLAGKTNDVLASFVSRLVTHPVTRTCGVGANYTHVWTIDCVFLVIDQSQMRGRLGGANSMFARITRLKRPCATLAFERLILPQSAVQMMIGEMDAEVVTA